MVHLAFPAAFQLPVDIDDALQMLENRTLDSITWKKIRPFYSIPLNVPSGDFLVLKRIFPDILKQLPSRQILSEKYSPWHEEQITSFFKDYPHLIEFEPILEFTGNCEKKGSMNVSIANTLVENAGEVHATFNLIPAPWLTIRARTDVGDDHARWSDRSIFFQPSKSLSLQLGNIDWPDEYGLMSGRFSDNITHEDRYSNWLYGNELSWNGFCLGYTRFKNSGEHLLHSLLYGHILNSNTQYALQSGFSFGEYHGMSTYLVIDKEGNRQNNVYGGITYQFDSKKMDLNLAIGATSQNYSAFPFLAILKYSYATGHCNVSVCHYNDTSGLQNSQKLYSNLIHIADSQSFEKITSVDILNKLCFSDFPSAGIRLTSTLIDFRPVNNTIHLSIDFEK